MQTRRSGGPVTRRAVIEGAVGAAWLVPVVTVVSMDSASAASAPPPPRSGGSSGAGGGSGMTDYASPGAAGAQSSGALAFTGSDVTRTATAGAATAAVGAAVIAGARRLRRGRPEGPSEDTP